jgi:putative colanic acid biosynthesis acetyltransferase WcaB
MNNFINYIFQDWKVNQEGSSKSRFILLLFRATQILGRLPVPLVSSFFRSFYILIVEWILGVELPWDTQIGSDLRLIHGVGLVVNNGTIIGSNCILRHSTTIGNKKLPNGEYTGSPKIGDNVEIGSNVVIIGPIIIGNNAVIGAGSVVVKDVPEGAVVVGNPAKVIRILHSNLPITYEV